jgi:hypothetical protein
MEDPMIRTAVSLIALIPAVALAQAVGASGQAKAKTEAQVGSSSVTSATTVDAEIAAARTRGLPERPIARRVAEGRAKGATEAQQAASAHQLRVSMESAAEVMEKAGRTPSGDEIERGGYAMERGYSRADIESVVKAAPADRSLVVALDVLARLQDRGVGTAQALAQVQSKLAAKADDAALESLAAVNANAAVNAVTPAAAVDGKAAVGAAAGAAGAAAGVTTKATGIIKKP